MAAAILDLRTHVRNMIYETGLDQPEEIARFMGLMPISEDGAEMEIRAAAERRESVKSLTPLIAEHAKYLAAISLGVHMSLIPGENTPEWHEKMNRATVFATPYSQVAFMSATTILSALLDLGVIQFSHPDGVEVTSVNADDLL